MALCFALFLGGMAACVAIGRSILWGIVFGLLLFYGKGRKMGIPAASLWRMAMEKGESAKGVFLPFALMGMVSGLWRSCATIPFLLYHTLQWMPPALFLLISFLLSMLMSVLLGTSTGTAATIGVVVLSIARYANVPETLAAGAVISGAFFGGTCASPVSSCAILLAEVTHTSLYDNIRRILKIQILPVALTALVFALLSVLHLRV